MARSGSILLFSACPPVPFWITVAGRSKREPHAGEFVDWNRPADKSQPPGHKRFQHVSDFAAVLRFSY